ncbi:MAG: hypothetical protein ACR2PL_18285 [Dehalococcoidia bacterium]
MTRVVNGDVWRFDSHEQPRGLEQFRVGERIFHSLRNAVLDCVAAHFGMDPATLPDAFAALELPVS